MPRQSSTQQSRPQRAGLNMHVNLSAIYHAHYSFTVWVHATLISRQSVLTALQNAFKYHGQSIEICSKSSLIAAMAHAISCDYYSSHDGSN